MKKYVLFLFLGVCCLGSVFANEERALVDKSDQIRSAIDLLEANNNRVMNKFCLGTEVMLVGLAMGFAYTGLKSEDYVVLVASQELACYLLGSAGVQVQVIMDKLSHCLEEL